MSRADHVAEIQARRESAKVLDVCAGRELVCGDVEQRNGEPALRLVGVIGVSAFERGHRDVLRRLGHDREDMLPARSIVGGKEQNGVGIVAYDLAVIRPTQSVDEFV
jgi:hypothetical protein